jgi:signal transduction histidine kinase
MAADPRFAPWRQDALRRGYASSAALPIFEGATCIGTLNLYAAEPDAFDDDEIALLEELTTELQIGMQHHRLKKQLASFNVHMNQVLRSEAATSATLALGHDVRNALQVMASAIALARTSRDEETRDSALADAEEAVESTVALFQQMLALSRRSALTDHSTEIDPQLKSSASLLARLAPQATLDLQLDAAGLRAHIAAIDLERLVINLAINASHAMASGGRLRIATGERSLDEALETYAGIIEPGRYLRLSVEDEGEGIEPSIVPRIFEPFFTTKSEKGTGLGLSAVRSIVRELGGGLEVDSKPGRGTTITLLLPLASS